MNIITACRLPSADLPLLRELKILVQEVEDNPIRLRRVLVEVDIVTCLWNKMLHERLRITIVRIGWLVVYARTVAVAHNVISFGGDGLGKALVSQRDLLSLPVLTKADPVKPLAS